MKNFLLLSLLSTIVSSLFGQPPTLIGHWRRLDFQRNGVSGNNHQQIGDLIIATDSNYTIIGDDAGQKSNISGWNTGETMKGKWEVSGKNYLFLSIPYLSAQLVYRIRRLNKRELYLQSKGSRTLVMKYKRL